MGNVLETVTIPAYPVIDEIKHTMMKYGAMGAMMSGSGPTVFGIFEKEDKAQEVCRLLKKDKAAKQVYLVHGNKDLDEDTEEKRWIIFR